MSSNRSLWQDKAGVPGTIRESQRPSQVADTELLIKVHAWAMNPADAMIQDAPVPLPFLSYPLILGQDVAGIVEVVGSQVSKFKAGDRVLAMARGSMSKRPEQGGFQDYVVLDPVMTCKIPDALPFSDAAVFPLCITSAAHGLFAKNYLGLPFPQVDSVRTGKSVFVWGGSSGIGSNVIQLASSAGFDVIATCSAHNFEHVKSLGASSVFDYNSPTAVEDVVAELDKGTCVGVFHAAGPVALSCQISYKSTQSLFVAATVPVPEGDVPEGVTAKMIISSGGNGIHEANPATFGGFLPEALSKGSYKVAPTPHIVPTKGVDGIQEALDILKKGVSAKKVIVEAI